jgi:carboxyl-terminal processing protease
LRILDMENLSENVRSYFDEVFNYIRQNSVKAKMVDWNNLQAEALAKIDGATTTTEVYPAIKLILERLGDNHSFLLTPEAVKLTQGGNTRQPGLFVVYPEGVIIIVFAGSPAERAGLQIADVILEINGKPVSALSHNEFRNALYGNSSELIIQRRGVEQPLKIKLEVATEPFSSIIPPQGRLIAESIGYLEVTAFGGNDSEKKEAYISRLLNCIKELDRARVKGWILDLRRNTGGNMFPMLAGIAPLHGAGKVAAFYYPTRRGSEKWDYWRYQQNGKFFIAKYVQMQNAKLYRLKRPNPPVAVLTSRYTQSSGEMVLLTFLNRPQSRTFGEASAGLPTANGSKYFSDGAGLFLTVALGADRTGKIYDSSIEPDEPVPIDWQELGTEIDPVIQAAAKWLKRVMSDE